MTGFPFQDADNVQRLAMNVSSTPMACMHYTLLSAFTILTLRRTGTLQTCSAGDSSTYERRNTASDDIVLVASLRTPLTKVGPI